MKQVIDALRERARYIKERIANREAEADLLESQREHALTAIFKDEEELDSIMNAIDVLEGLESQ